MQASPAPADHDREQVTGSAEALAPGQSDCNEALIYGAAAVKAFGTGAPPWEDIEPLIRSGWASRHNEACDRRFDWRLSWPAVKDGWRSAGGAFSPPSAAGTAKMHAEPSAKLVSPSPGAHVFDAFGEPAGRVKDVRATDFHLARPLARDVYVPFTEIRWPGEFSLRIGVSNGRLRSMGWAQPKLFGLFGALHGPDHESRG